MFLVHKRPLALDGRSENVSNVVSYFSDDAIDPYEEYRIVKFMLRPCLKASLSMPILQR